MSNSNKYGLTRASLTDKKKAVIRKRDGFGCVCCGLGVYTYEHFNPPFKDATKHDIDGICLLCGQCQLKASKNILSKNTIAEFVKNPVCKRQGYANEFFDLKFPVIVHLGNILIRTEGDIDHNILVLGNDAIIKVNAINFGEPFQFSAMFKDKTNNVSLRIEKNEWQASVKNWDIKQVGSKLSILNAYKDMRIVVTANSQHDLIFEELDTYYAGGKVHFDKIKGVIVLSRYGQAPIEIDVDSPQRIRSLTIP